MSSHVKNHLLIFGAGALCVFAFAPLGLWPLALVSIGAFFLSLRDLAPGSALIRGWWYGFGFFGAGISWIHVSIHDFSNTPLIFSIPMMLALAGAFGVLFALQAWIYKRFFTPNLMTFAMLWVGFEIIRAWILTGFPWLLMGTAFIDTWLAAYAPVVGVYGTSFVVVLIASALTQPAGWKLLLTLVIALGGYGLQQVHWTQPDWQHPLKVSLIQGNIPQEEKWLAESQQVTLDLYRALTLTEWEKADKPDLVVWPEAAIPVFYHEAWDYIEELSALARAYNSTWITGVMIARIENQQGIFFNSILSEGLGSGLYSKQKLVPFGEYVPLQDLLRPLGSVFNLPMSSFNRGHVDQPPLIAQGYKIAPFICYEIVYPQFVRNYARHADMLLTISNDGWFGRSVGPHQHFQIARMRALETGKMLLRVTNNGITAIVDHKGQVVSQLPQFQQAVLTGKIAPTPGQTPYLKMGNAPVYFICSLWLALAFIYRTHIAQSINRYQSLPSTS